MASDEARNGGSRLLGELGIGRSTAVDVTATLALILAWLLAFSLRESLDLSVEVAGARVFPLDVVCVALTLLACVRMVRSWSWDATHVLALLVLALVAIYAARGILVLDLQTGVNGARNWFYFAAALAYGATVGTEAARAILRLLIVTGAVLALAAIPFFAIDGIHSSSFQIERDGELVNWRPVVATGTLLILQAVILATGLRWPSTRASWVLGAFAITVVVLMQHRSVWLAAIVVAGVAGVAWAARRFTVRGRGAAVAAALGVALVAAVAIGVVTGRAEALIDSATSGGTAIWRTEGWEQLISANDAPSQIAFGNPAGEGFEREIFVEGYSTNVSAHNEFVDAYVRFGVLGVMAIAAVLAAVFLRRTRAAIRLGMPALTVVLVLVSQLVFSMAYSLDAIQGLLLGVLLAAGAHVARPGRSSEEPAGAAA